MSNMANDAKAYFSSKVENRAVIRFLYLKGKKRQGNTRRVSRFLSAPSYAQVKLWLGYSNAVDGRNSAGIRHFTLVVFQQSY